VRRLKETELNGVKMLEPRWRRQNAALLTLEDWSNVDVSSAGRPSAHDLNAMRMTDSLAHISAAVTALFHASMSLVIFL